MEGAGRKMAKHKDNCPNKAKYLSGKRVLPEPISKSTDIAKLIDNMDAYNGGRLRAACQLLKNRYLAGRCYDWNELGRGVNACRTRTFSGHSSDEPRLC